MQRRTTQSARPCARARFGQKGASVWPQSTHGMADASGGDSKVHNQRLETMGTELLIVGVSVFFYALCALFVRVCDRI